MGYPRPLGLRHQAHGHPRQPELSAVFRQRPSRPVQADDRRPGGGLRQSDDDGPIPQLRSHSHPARRRGGRQRPPGQNRGQIRQRAGRLRLRALRRPVRPEPEYGPARDQALRAAPGPGSRARPSDRSRGPGDAPPPGSPRAPGEPGHGPGASVPGGPDAGKGRGPHSGHAAPDAGPDSGPARGPAPDPARRSACVSGAGTRAGPGAGTGTGARRAGPGGPGDGARRPLPGGGRGAGHLHRH